jgi:hypothetical protein
MNVIWHSENTANLLSLSNPLYLSIGKRWSPIKEVFITEKLKDRLKISSGLLTELGLDTLNQTLNLCWNKCNNTIKLGPVIGIMISQPIMLLKPWVQSLYLSIAKRALEKGLLIYFFTPDFVDVANETIDGYFHNAFGRRTWTLGKFPLPDVLYNQVGNMSEGLMPSYNDFFNRFINVNNGIKQINPIAMNNKLITYLNLQNYSSAKNYLPDTASFASGKMIQDYMEKYNGAYLKPEASSLGKGVYKISKTTNGFVMENHISETNKSVVQFDDLSSLINEFQNIPKDEPYIIQQPIKLIHYGKKPMDFRVHMFKNIHGKWDIIGFYGRVGTDDGIVTGRLWGGKRVFAEKILKELYTDDEALEIMRSVENACRELAAILDRLHGMVGEIGFDIAIDIEKRVWMIEVNPKPNWFLPDDCDGLLLERDLADHLFDYTKYLFRLSIINTVTVMVEKL